MRATSKAVKKTTYKCKGGPYDGEQLKLATPFTYQFTAKGMKGRYVGYAEEYLNSGEKDDTGKWIYKWVPKKNIANPSYLMWESANG